MSRVIQCCDVYKKKNRLQLFSILVWLVVIYTVKYKIKESNVMCKYFVVKHCIIKELVCDGKLNSI